MSQETADFISLFSESKNFNVRRNTVFVEGITDVDLFELASKLEKEKTNIDLLGDNLSIVAAGIGELGGTSGVCRELVCFKNMSKHCLLANGRPKYRFVGLFDNDYAGRQAINDIRRTDTSILEYKDVFRLRPIMPWLSSHLPKSLKNKVEIANDPFKGLDWELEDLISEDLISFTIEHIPNGLKSKKTINGKTHYEWTQDGKARLHNVVKNYASYEDLYEVINVLKALWHYLGLNLPS